MEASSALVRLERLPGTHSHFILQTSAEAFLGFQAPPSPQHRSLRHAEVAMASEGIGKLPEWVMERQRALQSVHKLTHLKAPADRFTSVIIPGLLVATGLSLMGRGVYHMATGQGQKE